MGKSEPVACAHLCICERSLYMNNLMSDSENEGGLCNVISTRIRSASVSSFQKARSSSCLSFGQVRCEAGAPLKLAIRAGKMDALRSMRALAKFKQFPSNISPWTIPMELTRPSISCINACTSSPDSPLNRFACMVSKMLRLMAGAPLVAMLVCEDSFSGMLVSLSVVSVC